MEAKIEKRSELSKLLSVKTRMSMIYFIFLASLVSAICYLACHWRNRGYLRVLLIILSTSLQSSSLQDFLKRLLPKLSAKRTLRLCHSLCLRHLRDIVCFHLRVLPLSLCLLYAVGLLYHSIFRKNLFPYVLSCSKSLSLGYCIFQLFILYNFIKKFH